MAPVASLVVALIGALTAIFAATIGLKQWDIKKVLAYSTCRSSGTCSSAWVWRVHAGMFHLVTHAFFKACCSSARLGDPRDARGYHATTATRRAGHAQHGRAQASTCRSRSG
jgi:NADH-quinone oxidoreductase subunit L